MSPSRRHESIKRREAGATGKMEHKLPGRHRINDVVDKNKVKEIQTTATTAGFDHAAQNLKSSPRRQKVLVVPKKEHVPKAARAMRKHKVYGTVRTPKGNKGKTKSELDALSKSRRGFGNK